MESSSAKLKLTKFKVQMIYGFITSFDNIPSKTGSDKMHFEKWFEDKIREREKNPHKKRSGWTSMYRFFGEADLVLYGNLKLGNDLPAEGIHLKYPPLWKRKKDDLPLPIKSIESHYALKRNGAGAICITYRFESTDSKELSTPDVLAALLLAPRTDYGMKLHDDDENESTSITNELSSTNLDLSTKLKNILGYDDKEKKYTNKLVGLGDLFGKNSENSEKYCCSDAFKIFVLSMAMLIREAEGNLFWRELGEFDTFKEQNVSIPPIYEKATSDPQIPYMYVIGTVPHEIYNTAFAEQGIDYISIRENRKIYTKDIASIINRWLIDKNIPNASTDHLEKEGLIKDGAFLSNYMNSLLFTTFSGIVALTLKPEKYEGEKDKPSFSSFDPSERSISRFVEFSRMRWHQGISINRSLDTLIDMAKNAEPRQIPELFKCLLEQRSKIAKFMQNPITYRWDATVGSDVAKYIHDRVIGELEASTVNKLALVKEIVKDKLDIAKSESFLQLYEKRHEVD